MQLRVAAASDFAAIAALLSAAGLPALAAADFRAADFRIAHSGPELIGAIGVERYGDDGLLRSLVVAPSARGAGVGVRLVDAIEQHARAAALRSLVLLTTSAEPFFARRGYTTVARDAVPLAVRESTEFSTLCPASAVCMRKSLSGATP